MRARSGPRSVLKRVSERAGFARWLAGRDCTDCWTRERDAANGRDRDAWLAERRAEELSAVETWETKAGMPPLDGSDKAVEWARKVRHQLVGAAFDDMGSGRRRLHRADRSAGSDGHVGVVVDRPTRG